jgi:hypothetical protein
MRRVLPVAVMLAALVVATPAHAAKREVPYGWLGVVADGPFMEGAYGTQEAEWDELAASGAESVRIAVRWRTLQPKKSSPPDLETTDALVLAAAKRGLRLVPVVQATPDWAARYKHKHGASPPRKVSMFTSFLRRLVKRYGSNGTLWTEHPEVGKLPIRDWQIWNEPNFREFWSVRPFAPTFVPLMRASYKTVHRTDKHARVRSSPSSARRSAGRTASVWRGWRSRSSRCWRLLPRSTPCRRAMRSCSPRRALPGITPACTARWIWPMTT